MSEQFEEYIDRERERLIAARREVAERRARFNNEADKDLARLDCELAAIGAYVSAKTGKPLAVNSPAQPARRMSRRAALMRTLQAAPVGMTRGELLKTLGAKGDKSSEMAVSNALTAMQKQGQVIRQADGRWAIVGAESLQQAAE